MKVCVLVLGADVNLAVKTAEKIIGRISERFRSRHFSYTGMIPVVAAHIDKLNNVLKHGEALPQSYMEADRRLIMAVDNDSSLYLDRVGEELAKAYRQGASSEGMPVILRMSEAVMHECAKQHLNRIWVQDTSAYTATEELLSERLEQAGFSIRRTSDASTTTQLWRLMSELSFAEASEQKVVLVNECQEVLSRLAHEMDAEAVVLDRLAGPFLRARSLTAEWGPAVISGYDVFVNEAADWVEKHLSGEAQSSWHTNNPPPRLE